MMEARKCGDLAFHACDFAFDDCGTPHLPDAGDAVLRLRQLEPAARKALGAALLPRFQAWLAGLVAFEKARVLKCKVASRTAFDTGFTHRQWPEIG
ncbi:hypothetical protein N5C67_13865 [Comamonas thiooxydans]|uniref:hypothetical protein n=1 Tax=Comamonas thiooxydans TaxID=363952 RepID=UPI00244D7004|nr:hypothetical protein [Comamonas thiooxydans]MDH1253742.1 hypothetical protein [Comamonas thiooxydans]